MNKGENLLTMRNLEKATGFPRTTINYYIREGILPQPVKTARNMAYYDQRFVEDLNFIRKMKEQYNMSLEQIRKTFWKRSKGVNVNLMLSVRDRMFDEISNGTLIPPMTWEEMKEKVDLDEKSLVFLRDHGLLFTILHRGEAKKPTLYHSDNLVICQLFRQIQDQGIPMEEFVSLGEKLEQVAKIGVEAYIKYVFSNVFMKDMETDEVVAIMQNSRNTYQSLITLLHSNIMSRYVWSHKTHHSKELEEFFRNREGELLGQEPEIPKE